MNLFENIDFELGTTELRDDMPILRNYYRVAAEALYSYYTALKEAGFTAAQALEIVIAHGYNPESAAQGSRDRPFEIAEEE